MATITQIITLYNCGEQKEHFRRQKLLGHIRLHPYHPRTGIRGSSGHRLTNAGHLTDGGDVHPAVQ